MSCVVKIKAVLFDLHCTLVYPKDEVTEEELSDHLCSRGHEVSPSNWGTVWSLVSFVDYPRHGYANWSSYLSRIFWRLGVSPDQETLDQLIDLLESRPYQLFPDAGQAVAEAKKHGFKTAVVTTIAHFKFDNAIQPIKESFDLIMTGYEAGCDKSNPRMYLKVLDIPEVRPDETVMIGDDMQLDVLLPRRLGINTILLDRNGTNRDEKVNASARNLNEAIEYILKVYV